MVAHQCLHAQLAPSGYDDLENSPEVQEKIRRVVKQGHIDPEDFKGDAAYNVLGQKGIRPRNYMKKAQQEDGEEVSRVVVGVVDVVVWDCREIVHNYKPGSQ